MKLKKQTNFFIKAAIATFVCFCIITIVKLQFDFNRLKESRSGLEQQITECENEIDRLTEELNSELDDDYIIRVAREKLGYCLPDEIIFYSD